MTTLWLFYMTKPRVTPSSLEIQISEAIKFWKAETWSYSLYTLAYILVVQNEGYNQSKQKLSQISPFAKLLKELILVKFWRLLMMKEQFMYS